MLQVRASFLEVYNEEVRDLLSKQSKKPLDVREHRSSGMYVKGLTAIIVKSSAEIEKVLEVQIVPTMQISSHCSSIALPYSTSCPLNTMLRNPGW